METLLVQLGNKKYVCDSDYSIELQYRLGTKCPTTPVDGDSHKVRRLMALAEFSPWEQHFECLPIPWTGN